MTDTQKLDALDKLIAAVEAAMPVLPGMALRLALRDHVRLVGQAYYGSLDAALALHNALLPDLRWEIWRTEDWPTETGSPVIYGVNIHDFDTVFGADPARAWLLAILKAYRAQVAG